MKCLSREDIQKFIDREYDPAEQDEILQHLQGCRECSALHAEAESDKALFRKLFSVLEPDDENVPVPEFKKPVPARKRHILWILAPVMAAASVIGVILLLQAHKERPANEIPGPEMFLYQFQQGKDLNEVWHEKGRILLIQDEHGKLIQPVII
jgi:anti-sigma factor RsiW